MGCNTDNIFISTLVTIPKLLYIYTWIYKHISPPLQPRMGTDSQGIQKPQAEISRSSLSFPHARRSAATRSSESSHSSATRAARAPEYGAEIGYWFVEHLDFPHWSKPIGGVNEKQALLEETNEAVWNRGQIIIK